MWNPLRQKRIRVHKIPATKSMRSLQPGRLLSLRPGHDDDWEQNPTFPSDLRLLRCDSVIDSNGAGQDGTPPGVRVTNSVSGSARRGISRSFARTDPATTTEYCSGISITGAVCLAASSSDSSNIQSNSLRVLPSACSLRIGSMSLLIGATPFSQSRCSNAFLVYPTSATGMACGGGTSNSRPSGIDRQVGPCMAMM